MADITTFLCSPDDWEFTPEDLMTTNPDVIKFRTGRTDPSQPMPDDYTGCFVTNGGPENDAVEVSAIAERAIPRMIEEGNAGLIRYFKLCTFVDPGFRSPYDPLLNYEYDSPAMTFELIDEVADILVEIVGNTISIYEKGILIYSETIQASYTTQGFGEGDQTVYHDEYIEWQFAPSKGTLQLTPRLGSDDGLIGPNELAGTDFNYPQPKVLTFDDPNLLFMPSRIRMIKHAGEIVPDPAGLGRIIPSIAPTFIWDLGYDSYQYVLATGNFEWPLSLIVKDICNRSGIADSNLAVSQLTDKVVGCYSTQDDDAFVLIEELSKLYFFDPANYDGKLNFIKRGGETLIEVPKDDLVEGSDFVDKRERNDSIEVPRVFTMEYYSTDGWLTADKQSSDRSLDNRAKKEEKEETGVLMHHQVAANITANWHKVLIEEQKGYFEFELPDSYIYLTVSDIITINGLRLRIDEVEIDEGFQKYKAYIDRASAYTSEAFAFNPDDSYTPPSIEVGQTDFHAMDIPILSDNDDQLIYYIAAAGVGRWKGCSIEVSYDGGNTYSGGGSITSSTTMGYILNPVTEASEYVPDEVNRITVNLLDTSMSLNQSTMRGILNRENMALIGNEIVNFRDVVQTGPTTWEISYLLRGRKRTNVTTHSSGERFVMLTRQTLAKVPAQLVNLYVPIVLRATSIDGNGEPIIKSFVFRGKSQLPPSPSYLNAYRNSTGKIVISWQGTGKVGSGIYTSYGTYFRGFNVYANGNKLISNTLSEVVEIDNIAGEVEIEVSQVNELMKEGSKAQYTLRSY